MNEPTEDPDQTIQKNAKKYSSRFPRKYGNRAEVFCGECQMTRGGLMKKDLIKRARDGRIISKKRSEMGKISYKKNGLKPATKEELDRIRPKKR